MRRRSSQQDIECFVSIPAVSVNGKVIVETGYCRNPESFHDGETCAIDDGESLIRERSADSPSGFKIGRQDLLKLGRALTNSKPKIFSGRSMDAAVEQVPGLNQNMIGQHRPGNIVEKPLGAPIVRVPDICRSEPDRSVDEDT
jgi:hypothetical protein